MYNFKSKKDNHYSKLLNYSIVDNNSDNNKRENIFSHNTVSANYRVGKTIVATEKDYDRKVLVISK